MLALVFGRDGRLISAGDDRTIRVWDPTAGTEVCEFRGHGMGVKYLAVSFDGRRLAAGDKAGVVKIWDLTRNPHSVAIQSHVGSGEYLDAWTFSDDGQSLIVVADRNDGEEVHNVARWDAASGQIQNRRPLRAVVPGERSHRTFAFSGDGRRLAGVDWADPKAVIVYDPADVQRLATFKASVVPVNSVALDRYGDRIAYAGWKTDAEADGPKILTELIVADLATGTEVCRPAVPPNHIITPVAISPDGHQLACAVRKVTLSGEIMTRRPPRFSFGK